MSTDGEVFAVTPLPTHDDDAILVVDIATRQARFVGCPISAPHPFSDLRPVADPGEADDEDVPLTILNGDGNRVDLT